MIKKLLITFFIITIPLFSQDKEWELDKFSFYFEDDIYTQTDDGYSAGARLSLMYFIPGEQYDIFGLLLYDDETPTDSYVTYALTNQIFTPTDVEATELQVDDRPYAGWTYFEVAMHQASKTQLRSLSVQLGIVGPSSQAENIQVGVHKLIGSKDINGWDNQLHDEIGINIKYLHKFLFKPKNIAWLESSFMPFYSAEVGNIAINAEAGAMMKFGYNIQRDFGTSSIDVGGDPGIAAFGERERLKSGNWGLSLNVLAAGSVVGRDIFLDGNTFVKSHSVEKENLIGYVGLGFSVRYKSFIFDFIEIHNSKRFTKEKRGHGVGTMVFSWLF